MNLLNEKRKLLPMGEYQLGGGGGGTTQSTSTSYQTNIPEYAKPYVETMLGATQKQLFKGNPTEGGGFDITGFQPYKAYGGTYDTEGNQTSYDPGKAIAGFQPMQQQAQEGIKNMQLPGQYQQGIQGTQAAGLGAFDVANQANVGGFQNQVGGYMNPYLQQSLAPQLQMMQQQQGQQATQRAGQATQAGAFGGSRFGLQNAQAGLNDQLAQQNLVGNAYNQAFGQAQGQYNQNLQNQLSGYAGVGAAANQLAGLGGQQLQAQQGIYNAQNTAGAQQQALEQQKINQSMTDYANAQQYPLMQLGTMSNMIRGLPMQAQTTNQYVAAPNTLTQGIGAAGTAASLYNAVKAKGGVIKEMASGGITSVPKYDVGGAVENTLEDMDVEGLQRQIKESSSPSVKRMAQRLLREKQMGMAGGGIVAFYEGEIVKQPEVGASAEGRAGEVAAQQAAPGIIAAPPPPTTAKTNTVAQELGTSGLPGLLQAQLTEANTRRDRPTEDLVAEEKAAMKKANIPLVSEGQAQQRADLMAERANSKDEAERQRYMRLAQFFAKWGSTPGPTLVAGMQAVNSSVDGFVTDEKEAKKLKREIDKNIAELDNATRLEDLGLFDKARKIKQDAAKDAERINEKIIEFKSQRERDDANERKARIVAKETHDREIEKAHITGKYHLQAAGITQNSKVDAALNNAMRNEAGVEKAIQDGKEKLMKKYPNLGIIEKSTDKESQAFAAGARDEINKFNAEAKKRRDAAKQITDIYRKAKGIGEGVDLDGTGITSSATTGAKSKPISAYER
jgi:hypothetical protein